MNREIVTELRQHMEAVKPIMVAYIKSLVDNKDFQYWEKDALLQMKSLIFEYYEEDLNFWSFAADEYLEEVEENFETSVIEIFYETPENPLKGIELQEGSGMPVKIYEAYEDLSKNYPGDAEAEALKNEFDTVKHELMEKLFSEAWAEATQGRSRIPAYLNIMDSLNYFELSTGKIYSLEELQRKLSA